VAPQERSEDVILLLVGLIRR